MGQPMSSSYENRWLGDEKKSPLAHRKSLTTEESNSAPSTPSKKGKENPQQPAKKSQKEMTKAERRAIQEKQREEKAKRMNGQQQNKAGNNAKNDKSKSPAAPPAVAAVAAKKKTVTKGQQNQAPWLLHLDPPKRPEATKDLHPAVVQLGLYFSEHKIVGSNARCVAMLEIFAKVCWDNKTRWHKKSSFSTRIRKDGLIDILSLLNKGD